MPLRFGRTPGWADPLERLRQLERELTRPQTGMPSLGMSEYPLLNVWTGEHDVVITAEVPGVDPEEIDLTVHGNALTLKGVRRPETDPAEAAYHRRERSYGNFVRTVALPFEADPAAVQAECDAGILRIYIPRPEIHKPRRIEITGG